MKNHITFSLLGFLLLLFSGCPYQSTVPLSNQTEKWDEKHLKSYTGKWICNEDSYELDSVFIEFKTPATPDNSFIITTWDGLSTNKYNAWITQLDNWNSDAGFLNLLYVEIIQDTKTTYAIYKFKQIGNYMKISEANPEVFNTITYTTTDELRAHILRFHREYNMKAFTNAITWIGKGNK